MLTNDERLALLVVIDKKISPVLKDAKSEICAELVQRAETGNANRKPILVGGKKVGDVTVNYTKSAPVIIGEVDAIHFLESVGLTTLTPVKGWENFMVQAGEAVIYQPTGEVVPGMRWEAERPKNAAVKIPNVQAALNAFGDRLAGQDLGTLLLSSNSLLLEGGEDDE